MMTNPHDDLRSLASEHDEVLRVERITHHIQRIREDQRATLAPSAATAASTTRVGIELEWKVWER